MCRFASARSLMLCGVVLAGCAASDGDAPVYPRGGFNRAHSDYSSYGPYGSSSGFMNPYACWRSAMPESVNC